MNYVHIEVVKLMPKIIENLRENLLAEGKRMLIEKSYSELNIREVAKSCDVGTGTFYNYFSNKNEFVIEIFLSDWTKKLDAIDNVTYADMPLKNKLKKIYDVLDEFLASYRIVFFEMTMVKGMDSRRYDCTDSLNERLIAIIKHHMDKGELECPIPCEKFARMLVLNILLILKDKSVTFDELYKLFFNE